MKRVLITGHRGFVGRHFHHRLAADGWQIVGCDITDGRDARDFFRFDDRHFDLVVHLAAVVGGRRKIEGAPLDLAVDLAIDADLFAWATRTQPGRIVYFSSSAAYPVRLQHEPGHRLAEHDLNLDDVGNPDLTYGWAKLTGELLAGHAERQGLRVHVFRPFSGYGPGQALDYPFPIYVERARRRADPFEVWGDGRQVRDFIHIDDIIAATLATIEADITGPLNLGTGIATSFDELAEMAMTAAGYHGRIEHLTGEPVGVAWRVADTTKLHTVYTPRITLAEGLDRALFAARAA